MMILEKHQIWFAVGILCAVIIGAVVLNAYLSMATDKARTDQFHEDVRQQIADFRREMQPKLDAIAADKKITNPSQIVVKVPDYQQGVRPQIVIPGGVPTQQAAIDDKIPVEQVTHAADVPVGSLVIKPEFVDAYWKNVTGCAENSVNLGICQHDLGLVTKDRDNYKNLSGGGGFLQRLKSGKNHALCGALGGGGGIKAGEKSPAAGAIVGIGLFGVCELIAH